MLDHADLHRGLLLRKVFSPFTPWLLTHLPPPPPDRITGNVCSKMLAQQRPHIWKIILDGYNGVCTVQAKMKYEDGAAEGDWETPGSGDWIPPMSYIQYLLKYKGGYVPTSYFFSSLPDIISSITLCDALFLCPLPPSRGDWSKFDVSLQIRSFL